MTRLLRSVCVILLSAAALARLLAAGSGSGAVNLANSAPIVQTFNTLSNSASPSAALPSGWYLSELGTGGAADGSYVAGTGSSNSGGAYSFGAASSTERALGSVGSGTVTPIQYGARFTNTGSGPITAFAISYTGEMWRRGSPTAPEGLTFGYSTDATTLTTGTFTPLASLDFASPGSACQVASGASDGNSAPCRVALAANITGLAVNPGSSIWIRWTDIDTAGSDDGLAIDDVTVAATFSSDPTPPVSSGTISSNPASPGQAITLSGTIIPGFNPLSQTLTVTCDLRAIGGLANTTLPNDGSTFSYPTTISAQAALGASALPCRVTDDRTRSSTFSIPVTVLLPLDSRCGAAATPIGTIQGTGALSPLVGQTVDVEALVVGDFQNSGGLSGFYIEAPSAEQDPDPATSEGLFVFSAQATSLGDRVRVRGSVSEFTSATGAVQSKLTELSNVPTAGGVQVCSVGNALPAPVDVALPIDDVAHWERYEGMLVRFAQPLVVTGNFSLGQFGQIDLAPTVLFQPTQQPGSAAIWSVAADLVARSRIALDDGSTQSNAALNGGTLAPYPAPGLSATNTLRVGARVNPDGSVPLIGILDDRFGAYRIQPTSAVSFSNTPNPRPDAAAVAARAAARFRIVSANVLNFFVTLGSRGAATADELDHQRLKIVAELMASGGDVIGLSELQNFANGQTNGGTYTNAAIADLTSALAAATGRPYKYVDTIDPAKLSASNTVTDNGTDAIRSGLIYDGSAVTPVGVAALYYQQDQNRPSLAQTFQPLGGIHPEQQTFTVVVNHFRSKGSTCGLGNDDRLQGNCNGMRVSMALAVASWLGGNPTSDPAGLDRRIVAVGDFNAYFGEDPIQMFAASGYTDLIDALIGGEAYSYNFDSQAGYLDHAFANAAAGPLVKGVAELHVNADEPAALQALNTALKSAAAQAAYYAPDAFAASDHDPIVIGFNPLRGDFDDDGEITAKDQVMLLHAIQADRRGRDVADRRMDLNQDGELDQSDHAIWTRLFVAWQTTRHR